MVNLGQLVASATHLLEGEASSASTFWVWGFGFKVWLWALRCRVQFLFGLRLGFGAALERILKERMQGERSAGLTNQFEGQD